jgi:RNA polymerase-binding protein DksA
MDLEKAKQALLTKQQELQSRVERTHKHIYEKDEPVSAKFSEQATEMENADLVLALDEEGRMELNQIQHALARIESGEYFDCAGCGQAIGEARLLAIPFADKCINCAD